MPYYEVQLVAYCTVVIVADNEDEAGLEALTETPIEAYEPAEGEVKGEVKGVDLARLLAHADHTIC